MKGGCFFGVSNPNVKKGKRGYGDVRSSYLGGTQRRAERSLGNLKIRRNHWVRREGFVIRKKKGLVNTRSA